MAVENALAVVGVLNRAGYQLPEKAQGQLVAAGFATEIEQASAVAIAIMAGMDPQYLDLPKNIVALGQAYSYVTKYGAIPGKHFYATPYTKWKKEKGEWIKAGEEYAIVIGIDWLQSSAAEQGRQSNLSYAMTTRPVLGQRLNELLEIYAPEGYVIDKGNRGAEAHVDIFNRRGEKVGETEWVFGYYLAKGVQRKDEDGKIKTFADDSKMPSDTPNNSPQRKAERRAQRALWRQITRELFRVDGNSVQERLKGVATLAYDRALTMVENGDVRKGMDAEAYDADPEAETPGDDGAGDIVDGEYEEVPPEVDPAADMEAQALAASVDAVDLAAVAAVTFDALPDEMQKLVNSIRGARSDTRVLDDAQARLRMWIGDALKPLGANAAEELNAGLTVCDLIIRVIFGGHVGENVAKEQAAIAWKALAKLKGKNWEFVPEGEGALLVREVYIKALEAFNSDFVDTF